MPNNNFNITNSFNLMQKKTKIIATLGPACESEEKITDLINKGANIIRFNTKHNTYEWHNKKIELVRKIAKKLEKSIGVLVDLQGPDIRIEHIKTTPLILAENTIVTIGTDLNNDISIAQNIFEKIEKGQKIVIDDGKHVLEAINKTPKFIECNVIEGGILSERKGAFFPGLKVDIPALTERDLQYIKLANEVNAEYCALSFVRTKNDVEHLRHQLNKRGISKTNIVSKIETVQALDNIDEIIEASDILMVARGDLGVEVPMEAVPIIQKKLVKKMIYASKPIIVATQMLKSMIDSQLPTRAEISDIANASFDGADAVMLSEETAIGANAIKAVSIMARTLKYNEMESLLVDQSANIKLDSPVKAIVYAAEELQKILVKAKFNPKFFIVLTSSGKTARLLSATRPGLPIYAFCPDEFSANILSIAWGVTSFNIDYEKTITQTLKKAGKYLIKKQIAEPGDMAIVIAGQNIGHPGHTDSIRYYEIK